MPAASYRPEIDPAYWAAIGPFVTSCVVAAAPSTRYSEAELFAAATPFALWAWQTAAMPLERHSIFSTTTIEHFIAVGLSQYLSKASRNTMRSRLLRIADALLSGPAITRTLRPLGGSDPAAPYSAAEITTLKSWARAQRTPERKSNAEALLALGLGAGLSGREIIEVQVGDITVDSDGVLVAVRWGRPRDVPVLRAWERALAEHVERFEPATWAFRKEHETTNRNLITDFVSKSRGKIQLQARRMRSTWIVHHLNAGTPPVDLMRAAGVNALEALDRFAVFVTEPEAAFYRSRLRGSVLVQQGPELR